jgi:YebC/PmpR family DNA-binding regulatory protein
VPLDTIERAVKRGTGELEGVNYEPIMYEGYAPAGVALYIDVLTDNRNRTGSEIRSMLSKNGGSLAEPGAVSWQFDRKGIVLMPKGDHDEDELMMIALEAGAEDLADVGEAWQLTSEPTDLNGLRDALESAKVEFTSADLVMVPQQTIELDEGDAKSVLRLIEILEDNDDVQDVYANFDISDEVLEILAAE